MLVFQAINELNSCIDESTQLLLATNLDFLSDYILTHNRNRVE